jgi:hypothetical protein
MADVRLSDAGHDRSRPDRTNAAVRIGSYPDGSRTARANAGRFAGDETNGRRR